jgi:uncharacterized protein (DUF362 family)
MSNNARFLTKHTVAIEQSGSADYATPEDLIPHLRTFGREFGWATGTNAFGNIIPAGARVLVKPNLVLHENNGPWSFDAVITHPSFVQAVVSELLNTNAGVVAVGDSPIQSCDFQHLMRRTKLDVWSRNLKAREPRFTGVHDFRRTIATVKGGIRQAKEDMVDRNRYGLFDLGRDSLLEPITTSEPRFRITGYDPKFLAETHQPGRHQYLIAKDVLDADVVVSLPKLKMHKKAGVTNALKNFVGINGNKEYLPHHRIGGSSDSGDCYPGKSRVKELLESLYDYQNGSLTGGRSKVVAPVLRPLSKYLSLAGDETGIEGAWSGNDTVWRMSLDLNRILMYGRPDGSMADTPQRTVLHICDAIIAGQGNGPLAPEPFDLGMIIAGENAAAIDYVGARLLGMNPSEIPIIRGAFDNFRWPLAGFSPQEISIRNQSETFSIEAFFSGRTLPKAKHVPPGWSDVVQRSGRN